MAVDLAFLGVFPNPYGKDTRSKLKDIAKGLWEPDSEDFLKVVNQSKLAKIQDISKTGDILDFCGAIVINETSKERADRSIARIDLVTHSSPDWIALSGSIFVPQGRSSGAQVKFDTPKDDKGLISHYFYPCICEYGLAGLDDNDIVIVDRQKKKSWTLADVRKKFTPDAKLFIYSCEAGAAKSKAGISTLLKHISQTIGFNQVGAFTGNIKYDYVNGKIYLRAMNPKEEGKTAKPLSLSARTLDYRALDTSSYFVSVKSG
jgi:hypothetical protein